jgi:phage shock protein E
MKAIRRISVLFSVLGLAAACQTPVSYAEPEALARLVAEKSEPYLLLDVRTPEEYASGHILTAVNIPNTEIAQKLPTADTSALIIVYCASGRRSAAAAKVLTDLGYKRVVDFGGVSRWKGALVKGDKPEAGAGGGK